MPFININSKKLFYTNTHPSSSESKPQSTTLFLHGLGSSSNFYFPIIPDLSRITRCLTFDYPGSGLSELGDEELSIESLARDVIEFLRNLEITSINLVGHSMGGLLASYIASTSPSFINGIVLLGPVDPSPNLGPILNQRIETIKSTGLEELATTIPTSATGPSSTPLQKAFIRTLILSTSESGYISLCKVIANAKTPDYGCIKKPLLMVVGEEDKTSPLSSCEGILRAYGSGGGDGKGQEEGREMDGGREDKRLIVLKGVGHWFCVEDAEGVGSVLGGFLESVG